MIQEEGRISIFGSQNVFLVLLLMQIIEKELSKGQSVDLRVNFKNIFQSGGELQQSL